MAVSPDSRTGVGAILAVLLYFAGQAGELGTEAMSEDAVRATLARDPWSETHLRVDTIDPWTIRLDGRRA